MSENAECLQCHCNHCGQNLEFPADGVGTVIECPACHQKTMLYRAMPRTIEPCLTPPPQKGVGDLSETSTNETASPPPTAAESASPPPLLRMDSTGNNYVITLSPGEVRYIDADDFLGADIENVISQIKQVSESPIIAMRRAFGFSNGNGHGFHAVSYDGLVEGEAWESRLRLHHTICRMILNHGTPYGLYYSFHCYLSLGKLFAFDECLQSWLKEASKSTDIVESYLASAEHFVLNVEYVYMRKSDFCFPGVSTRRWDNTGGGQWSCVFRKTDFVKKKLNEMVENAADVNGG